MNRAPRRRRQGDRLHATRAAFAACALAAVAVIASIACSATSTKATNADAGASTTGGGDDASLLDAGAGFTLDGFATIFPDATVSDGDLDVTTIAPPEASTGCRKPAANDPCGLDPQCGCTSVETCEVDGGGTVCVTAGTALAGHGCTTTASCAPGLTCFNGACRPYCTNSIDAGCDTKLAEGGSCIAIVGQDGGPLPNYDVCTFRCQLQDPNACGPTGDLFGGCVYNGNGGTDCEGVGLTTLGASCTYLNDCRPGLVCVGTCLPWCRVGHSPSDCGDGQACQGFGSPITSYGVQYGYCP